MTQSHPFEFHGKAGEFFKIWIVNLTLSIVTLGIYSAWAKVRTKKYFYNNTLLMNAPFDYVADPVKILKGRLVALALFMAYYWSSLISPYIQLATMLLLIPVIPLVVIRSLKFNLYNSVYRNIRFHFNAGYFEALKVFIGLPVLAVLSFGLAYPYMDKEIRRFIIANSRFGTSAFTMDASAGAFYGIYTRAVGVGLLVLLLIVVPGFVLGQVFPELKDNASSWGFLLGLLSFYPVMLLVYGYTYTATTNLVFNCTSINDCQFASHLQTTRLCWLYFSNTLAIVCSLGLMIPWAKIRLARYRLSQLSAIGAMEADAFIRAEAEKVEAIGEEFGDLLDFDLGL